MDKKTLSASRFRLDFPKLEEKTEVTVHGKIIGEWTPRKLEDLPVIRGRVRPEEISRG